MRAANLFAGLISLFSLASLAALGGCRGGTGEATAPNVILISIDTLRADHLGTYGYQRNTTPNIDQLAADGVVFTEAHANACNTLASHMTMMTGLLVPSHDVTLPVMSGRRGTESVKALAREHKTLAERFKAAGYRTARFVHSRDYFLDPALGFGRGVDEIHPLGLDDPRGAAEIRKWLDENAGGGRFFLFIHSKRPHAPYVTPSPYDRLFDPEYRGPIIGNEEKFAAVMEKETLGRLDRSSIPGILPDHNVFLRRINRNNPGDIRHLMALYDGAIFYADALLGEVFEKLREKNLLRNSIVVITSDHGEEFMEHGRTYHHQPTREVLHVPLIVRFPGSEALPPERKRISRLAQTADIVPTILDLAGAPVTSGPGSKIDGKSLKPLIDGRTSEEIHPELFAHHSLLHDTPRASVLTTRWKLIRAAGRRDRLYNVAIDPAEKRDVSRENPEIVTELSDRLRRLEVRSGGAPR